MKEVNVNHKLVVDQIARSTMLRMLSLDLNH